MSIFETLRQTANRFGFDFCRVGRARLGRILALDVVEFSPKAGLIFDVGANTGRAARWFSKIFPGRGIWSFEPGLEAFNELSVAPDLQHLKKFNVALSDADGTATLNTFRGSELNSILPHSANAIRYNTEFVPKGSEQVKTIRLDTFCLQHKISEIEFLKIDTQGSELRVLRGAEQLLKSGGIHLIQLEVNFVPVYEGQATFSDIYDGFLKNFGFRLMGFYDIGRDTKGCVTHCDVIFKLEK